MNDDEFRDRMEHAVREFGRDDFKQEVWDSLAEAINARGSAFNPNGVSGAVYANPTSRGGIASGNSHVVAQYDVACYHQTNRVMRQAASGHGH